MTKQNDKIAWSILKWILNTIGVVGLALSAWSLTLLIEVQQNTKIQGMVIQRIEDTNVRHSKILLELSKWQAAVQASRFTKADSEAIKEEIDDLILKFAIADIPGLKERIKELESK